MNCAGWRGWIGLLLLATLVRGEPMDRPAFVNWMNKWNKVYEPDALFKAYETWRTNMLWIANHNAANYSYTVGMNQFGDLTAAEFGALYGGLRWTSADRRNSAAPIPQRSSLASPPPPSVDWTRYGAVSPIGNQGSCGACYTFSAAGAIEGAAKIHSGNALVPLSKQQLLDCSGSEGNLGCDGGLMDNAFKWVMKYGGIARDVDYPYVAQKGTCRQVPAAAKITTFIDVEEMNETALVEAVALGPVSAGVESKTSIFQFYSGGVLDNKACGTDLDHAILLTGYGTDPTFRKDYWIVKNSWGVGWGLNGYIRLVRNKNQCGISQVPSYVII